MCLPAPPSRLEVPHVFLHLDVQLLKRHGDLCHSQVTVCVWGLSGDSAAPLGCVFSVYFEGTGCSVIGTAAPGAAAGGSIALSPAAP